MSMIEDRLSKLEQSFAELKVSQEIRNVISCFYRSLDEKDLKTILQYFTSNAVFILPEKTYSGQESIKQFYQYLDKFPNSMHVVSNVVVKTDKENTTRAHLSWMFSEDGVKIARWGRDEIIFKKEAGKYKIAKIQVTRYALQGA